MTVVEALVLRRAEEQMERVNWIEADKREDGRRCAAPGCQRKARGSKYCYYCKRKVGKKP